MNAQKTQTGESSAKQAGRLSLTLVGDVAKFVFRLFRSPKVPKRVKFLLVGLGVYLASPLDIVPDAVPVLGYVDDAFIAAAALGLAARWLPRDVVDELWEGEVAFDEALKLLQGAVRNIMRRKRAG
jgi:uncharacterized membrane protein YkvA (DUF1232 family)